MPGVLFSMWVFELFLALFFFTFKIRAQPVVTHFGRVILGKVYTFGYLTTDLQVNSTGCIILVVTFVMVRQGKAISEAQIRGL